MAVYKLCKRHPFPYTGPSIKNIFKKYWNLKTQEYLICLPVMQPFVSKFPLHSEWRVTSGRCFKGQGYFPTAFLDCNICIVKTHQELSLNKEWGISLLKSKIFTQSGIPRLIKENTFCGISFWAHNNAKNWTLSIAIFVQRPLFLDA